MILNTDIHGDHVTINLQDCELPEDTDKRDEVLKDLKAAIATVLANHSLESRRTKIIDGHTYSSLEPDCPICRERLRLTEFALDAENGGHANAICDCGWTGTATYRLIDLQDRSSTTDQEATNLLEETSCVRLFDLTPDYIPY